MTMLASPDGVWNLAFGSRALLQPECINAYPQALIRTLQADNARHRLTVEQVLRRLDL